jgi:hypothetical protein
MFPGFGELRRQVAADIRERLADFKRWLDLTEEETQRAAQYDAELKAIYARMGKTSAFRSDIDNTVSNKNLATAYGYLLSEVAYLRARVEKLEGKQ